MSSSWKNVIFFHPDLGIGGAERLVIDAALGLKARGHRVTIFTSHCDRNHCFEEARDGTLDVRVRGDWLFPATVLGRFRILLAILRQLHLLTAITISQELGRLRPTVFFVDQLSAGIPVMRWWWKDTRILFYCHFPDFMLASGREKWWKRWWRWGFDWLEGWTIRGADRVVVNSAFTKGVVEGVWQELGGERGVGVVYPCVDTKPKEKEGGDENQVEMDDGETKELWKGKKLILSINRFEKKKNIELALKAFAGLGDTSREGVRLVISGGYDNQVEENVSYHNELVSLANSLGLRAATTKNVVTALNVPEGIAVLFLLSVPAQLKSMLLNAASLLVYTPSNEHFGIVPLEAMLAGVPVLAANSGGPLETIIDGETGWLRPMDEVEQWTEVLQRALHSLMTDRLKQMGINGKKRVEEQFSETRMADRFDEEIEAIISSPRQPATDIPDILLGFGIFGMILIAVIGFLYRVIKTR
ncbi:Alpha-1,3-mannosyltransferase-like protein [Toensbergia leucococca]|nr:Alpha-1,3-mannosyltransferase-like protein [Toensbergia leucococca]